ncbi:hypothetical protein LEP1GSC040_2321 [Leptospira santarosai str. 2000030832]|nr:hypothetical protein LEP1GSC040_2321 [Leptospira santarosai str. 2000030832]
MLELFFFVHFSFFSVKKKVNLFQAKTKFDTARTFKSSRL